MLAISVVICTKDRLNDLNECVRSIIRQSITPLELVIVDVSSTELVEQYVKELQRRVPWVCRYIKQTSGGLTHARNLGVERCAGDVILFLDDDVILDSEYLRNIEENYKGDNELGGVQGLIQLERSTPFWRFFHYAFLLDSPRKGKVLSSGFSTYPEAAVRMYVETLTGCNMSYRSWIFQSFSFDESFTGYGYIEDQDFSYRVGKKYHLLLEPRAKLIHKVSQLGRSDSRSSYREIIRNLHYFIWKNVGLGMKQVIAFYWACVGLTLQAIARLIVHPCRKNYYALLGIRDGVIDTLRITGRARMSARGEIRTLT
jgi:glycosyltransferase involved in cell wall biosynthesis